jgi:MacB-like periplasmic core domain
MRGVPAFDAAIGTARVRVVAVAGDGAQRLRGEAVDAGYFDLLGLHPSAGRLLDARDHRPGAPPVVVLGYGLWSRTFGASPSALGSTLRTQGAAYTIVGVAPRSFSGTVEDDAVEFWTPMEQYEPMRSLQDRDERQTWILARLAPGVPMATAEAQLSALTLDWRAREPQRYRHLALRVEPFGESWRRGFRRGTGVLIGAAGCLLAIAAMNVGCLLLARVLDRRFALGASRRSRGAPPGAGGRQAGHARSRRGTDRRAVDRGRRQADAVRRPVVRRAVVLRGVRPAHPGRARRRISPGPPRRERRSDDRPA